MLVPPPLPAVTLAPDIEGLTPGQDALLQSTLASLSGRVGGVIVTAAWQSLTHEVLELDSTLGPMMVMERTVPVPLPE
ncbi:MAG: hypothetical protein AB1416_00095 [Actinomycetota bacterium]